MFRTLSLVVILLIPVSARAEAEEVTSSPEALAKQAAGVLEAECADVATTRATSSAEALAVLGPVFAEVSRVYDATEAPFLLYWRARLAACLSQEERAATDYKVFIAAATDQPAYTSQVIDSRKRLERLQPGRTTVMPAPITGVIAVGSAILVTGVGLTIGGYQEGTNLYPGLSTGAGWDSGIGDYRAAYNAQGVGVALAGTGTALLTASLIKMLVDKHRRNQKAVSK